MTAEETASIAPVVSVLAEILRQLARRRGAGFSGAGLLAYRAVSGLPVTPLRPGPPDDLPGCGVLGIEKIVRLLLVHTDQTSEYHDGFHLISEDGRLTHLAQYFSPPIVPALRDPVLDRVHGGRLRAAQYGSCLPEVIASGVLSQRYGPIIFVNGVRRLAGATGASC